MNKICLSLTVALIVLVSCGGNKNGAIQNVTADNEVAKVESTPVNLQEVAQYFATFKPTEITTLDLDKAQFEEKFNPARTMDNAPTIVNFDNSKVAAIVLPETAKDTKIKLENASITDNILTIEYSIETVGEDRSFTIVPIKAFQYNTSGVESISFVNKTIIE